jgi:hypothetical protein
VNPEEFKAKVRSLASQDYKLEFLGDKFDQIVTQLTDTKALKIYDWVEKVLKKEIQPITVGSDKTYKDWKMRDLLVFRHQVNITNVEHRILYVKVKNSFFIEFHFGDHKYYDKVRKDMDLKKTSY